MCVSVLLLSWFYKAKVKQTQNIFSYSSSADILRREWFRMFYFFSFGLYFYELFPVHVPIWKQKNHYKDENKMVCITFLTCFVLCLQALKTASHIFHPFFKNNVHQLNLLQVLTDGSYLKHWMLNFQVQFYSLQCFQKRENSRKKSLKGKRWPLWRLYLFYFNINSSFCAIKF